MIIGRNNSFNNKRFEKTNFSDLHKETEKKNFRFNLLNTFIYIVRNSFTCSVI